MSSDPQTIPKREAMAEPDFLAMPRPTVAPVVVALGLALLGVGVATSPAFLVIGLIFLVSGLCIWVGQLLPGKGHFHEFLVAPAERAGPVIGVSGTVEQLRSGMPGYRLRMPAEVHPISAGFKGGLVGGVVMTVPALTYGVLSGHGLWYPANLLAGMVLPSVDRMSVAELEQFRLSLLILAVVIHAVNSMVFGMIYGVILPTLPRIPRPLAWGGLLIPLLWTAVSFGLMRLVNPLLYKGVDWPWFIASQFVFGVVAALTIMSAAQVRPLAAGLLGGCIGGLLMPIPAVIWSLSSGHGIWYPANLLAGMVLPKLDRMPLQELRQFHTDWLLIAIVIHVAMSVGIGLIFGLLLPRLGPIPTPLAWGGVVLPLVWTAVSFGLMGIVNPLLQERVDWPWFIASQFVFGLAAAIVVDRSEKVYIPPAGRGPDSLEEFVEGSRGVQP
jgi:uncharacterized membrane protein YagU involved in acid resistance